ncbi:uncharacterized protein LOC117299704 [Asterias rubens]|uniref:uncharacterized protein LOC117299704 n=1 Tax=Asterias rubens TaxID=7604 RepID=UPI001455D628|nr:uncharacterized protein LOC117299704 [Asterias rubens]
MHLLVALQRLLVIIGFLGGVKGQTVTLRRWQDAGNPPQEYVEVTEGETLTVECAVSNNRLRDVYWGKSGNVWLTHNLNRVTSDLRVSVSRIWGNYYNWYSMQISDITLDDSGNYICYATWYGNADRAGYVFVAVRNFPKEQPVCSTNKTASPTYDSVYLRCDTAKGYPGVSVTWTVNGAGDDEIPSGNVVEYSDGTGRERVQSELRLISTDWENRHQTREFVCTVASSEFPGLNHTCSVNVTVSRDVTTEANFDRTVPPTGSGSSDSGLTQTTETTSESAPDPESSDALQNPKGSDDPQTQGSSAVDSTLALAIIVPALFIALCTILICVLKLKRQRKKERERKTKGTSSTTNHNKASAGEVVFPYSVTQLENDTYTDISSSANDLATKASPGAGQFDPHCRPYSATTQQKPTVDSGVDFSNSSYESYQPSGDVEQRVSPYEVELDLNGDCAVYSQIPDESKTQGINGQQLSTDYEAVQSPIPEEHQQDNVCPFETETRTNLSRKSGSQSPQSVTHANEFERVDDSFIEDESDEGSVDNPLYEPFKNGHSGANVKPEPNTDDQHIYQMI